MKDSQQYVLIETVTLRYVPLEMSHSQMCITNNDSGIENEAHRSFQIKFNKNYNDLAILIHFKHLQISDLQLYYRKKKLRNKNNKKANPQRKMRLHFNTTLELLTYLSSKSYKIDWLEITFKNGWAIKAMFLNVQFITNTVKERNQLFEKIITISGQGPIDINTLEINKTYILRTNGEVRFKPLFY